jgi:Pyruvate/2-oxoacid:ferredoxin oxidoreductase delta subunit
MFIQDRPTGFFGSTACHTVMLNWEGVPVDFTADKQAEMIRKIKPIARDHGTRIIANIHPDPMYVENEELFRRDIRILLEAGPDLLEACPCPYHFPPEMTYPDQAITPELLDLTARMWGIPLEETDVPYIAKSTFHFFRHAHGRLAAAGARNFHVTEGPWFYGSIVDIEEMKPLVPGPAVITYGSLRRPIMNNHVARTAALGNYAVMSSGGVWTPRDAIERIMCGSRMVGLHTAIQYHGHSLFKRIIDGLSEFLDKKAIQLEDIIGAAQPAIVSQEAHEDFMRGVDLPAEALQPVIDAEKCTCCGRCGTCIHGGIQVEEKKPEIHLDLCVRCGVCESSCPFGAVALSRVW